MIHQYRGISSSTGKIIQGTRYDIPNIFGEINTYIVENPKSIKDIRDIVRAENKVTKAFINTGIDDMDDRAIFDNQTIEGYITTYIVRNGKYHEEYVKTRGIVELRNGIYSIENQGFSELTAFIPISELYCRKIIADVGVNYFDDTIDIMGVQADFINKVVKTILGKSFHDKLDPYYCKDEEALAGIYKQIVDKNNKYKSLKKFVKNFMKWVMGNKYRRLKIKDVDKYNMKNFNDIIDDIRYLSFKDIMDADLVDKQYPQKMHQDNTIDPDIKENDDNMI